MKLTILKDILKKGIGVVERTSSKSFTLPILSNILILAEKNFLRLSTTDLDLGVNWWSLVKTEKEGSIAIPGKTLSNFINSLPNKPVDLEIKEQNIKITCDNYQTLIKGFNADEFPIIPKINEGEFILVNSKSFCQNLNQISGFASTSNTRPEISGVYFLFQKKTITLVTTDSFRLGEKKFSSILQQNLTKDNSFILPQKAAREIVNIFGDQEGDLKIYLNPNQVLFETQLKETPHPHIQLISRLIEGDYPNYQEIIPKKFETKVVVQKGDLINQIKLASIFSGKINEIKIKTDLKQKKIDIFSQDSDLGEYKSFLSAQIEGKDMELSFNHKFLLDGLISAEGNEIILEFSDSEGPAVLKTKENDSYLYLVMPIRTN